MIAHRVLSRNVGIVQLRVTRYAENADLRAQFNGATAASQAAFLKIFHNGRYATSGL